MYYGSSFAYLTAIGSLMAAQGLLWIEVLPPDMISVAQFGIIMSGLVSIAAGILVRISGRDAVEKILPPSITGSVAMIIGLTLAGNALADAAPMAAEKVAEQGLATVLATDWIWVISLVTLLSTIIYSRYLKGFLGQLPLLLGALTGCATAGIIYAVGGDGYNAFRAMPEAALNASLWSWGPIAVPAFTFPKYSLAAVAAIMPVAIATIPDLQHIYQLDIYVNDLAAKKGRKLEYKLADMLDRNLIGDGIGDMISGLVGGPAEQITVKISAQWR